MHRTTKATAIPQSVKEAVTTRDKGRCIFCGRPGKPVAHVVRRSQLGMGIEQTLAIARWTKAGHARPCMPALWHILKAFIPNGIGRTWFIKNGGKHGEITHYAKRSGGHAFYKHRYAGCIAQKQNSMRLHRLPGLFSPGRFKSFCR